MSADSALRDAFAPVLAAITTQAHTRHAISAVVRRNRRALTRLRFLVQQPETSRNAMKHPAPDEV